MSIYQNQYYTKEDTEEPEYETPDFSKRTQNRGSEPPRSFQQPGPSSSRSTPDLLNKIQDLFGSDEEKPKLRSSKDVRKVTNNLEQSYQYFKDKHAKAENDEGRNKVLNAAHRHYQKSKKTHKKFTDIVEAAYLEFLESIRSTDFKGQGNDDDKVAEDLKEEYSFFLEQYNKAKSEEDRDAANSAAHRYFALQYQSSRSDKERAMSSVAYQEFLDSRKPGAMFTGKGLPTAVRTQFNYHLENFNKARNEEQRVEAMTAAHQYFMQLTASCDSEEDLNKLGASYQEFLSAQKESLVEFRETQAYASASASASASRSASSRAARSSKKITTTTKRTRLNSREEEVPGPGQGPEPGKSNSKKVEKYETVDCIRMKKPWYYVRWLYLCLFFQMLFIFGILIVFLFGAFAGCWVQYTLAGFILMIALWVLFVLLVLILGLFAPKRKEFPQFVLWLVLLTVVLSLALSLTALYFEGVAFFFVVVIKGLATVFLLHFILSLLPMTYSPARLVVMSLLCFALWLIAVVLYIALTVYTWSTAWIVSVVIVFIITLWVAIDAAMVVDNKFHSANHDEWMFGATCCYTDVPITAIHIAYLPFNDDYKSGST
ncbi:hypothetical protein ACHWQZ_G009780 [Mnemiopsis leidyi]